MAKRRRRIPRHLLSKPVASKPKATKPKPKKPKATKPVASKPKPEAKPAKSQRHAEAGRGNEGKTYNDVAQGRENVVVHTPTADATLRDINTRIATVSAESDDRHPEARRRMNTPGWLDAVYTPGSDDVAAVFAEAFNEDEEFIPGLDDQIGPSLSDLAAIECEIA